MNIVLISTYELGRQPFGLASPAAWLRRAGADVTCLDLSREPFREAAIRDAALIAFYLPMHTATRLAVQLIGPIRQLNPLAHLCFYGLYAPVNEAYLRSVGARTILGGEFEESLLHLVERLRWQSDGNTRPATPEAQPEPTISLSRLQFQVPDRSGLPPLKQYAHLILPHGAHRIAGSTDASRGCKHLCRHCPVVPVYSGQFRIVQRDVVLEDIRRQVAAGAQHITFGDPDFWNGPTHARSIVEALHHEFPHLSYDVTIKVEHLLKHRDQLPVLRDTGCAFVITAVESLDDAVLEKLQKGHTRADFFAVVELFRELGLVLQPTFVPFTPWTTLEGYFDLLQALASNGLAENVAPVQLAIRLLISAGSRLLELDDIRALVTPFDQAALVYPWRHPEPSVDALCNEVQRIVAGADKRKQSRPQVFGQIWKASSATRRRASTARRSELPLPRLPVLASRATVPYLNEPWYC